MNDCLKDEFIRDFDRFYADIVRKKQEKVRIRYVLPQPEVRFTAKWGRRDEPDPELF